MTTRTQHTRITELEKLVPMIAQKLDDFERRLTMFTFGNIEGTNGTEDIEEFEPEHERIASVEARIPELEQRLDNILGAPTSFSSPLLTEPLFNPAFSAFTLPGPLMDGVALQQFTRMLPWILLDGLPTAALDGIKTFEDAAVKAGILAITVQFEIGSDITQTDAIPQGDTPAAFKPKVDSRIKSVEETLKKAKEAAKLAGGAAVAAKKFNDAKPDIERAVASFLGAESDLAALKTKMADRANYDTDADRTARKNELKAAAEKVKTDIGNVKEALTKITA